MRITPLPPGLEPCPIRSMAPAGDRFLSVLITIAIYACCGLGLVILSRHQAALDRMDRSVVQLDSDHQMKGALSVDLRNAGFELSRGDPQKTETLTRSLVDVKVAQLRVLHRVPPEPPPIAGLKSHEQVALRMTIDEQGKPVEIWVLSGPPILWNQAVQAAMLWRFEPLRIEGRPCLARFDLTMHFRFT